MPTKPFLFSLVLCTIVLFACNNKRTNIVSAVATKIDTLNILRDEDINIMECNNSYEQSITQTFTVIPGKVSILTGKKGLRVTVNSNALEKEDGTPVDGKIKVSMIELTNTDELFKSNASTISNGRLLASGGSYFIDMECNGQKLHIKKGRHLKMEFPKLKKQEMELFYGERNEGNMNWIQAGIPLQTNFEQAEDDLSFFDNNQFSPNLIPVYNFDTTKIYETLHEPVYYYEKKMTIKDLVDTINRYSSKIYIDTVYVWPKQPTTLLPGQRIDTNFLYRVYGPPKQYKLKTYQALADELARKEKSVEKEEPAINWQRQSLANQLQNYYAPSDITFLGWMNCDRFYNNEKAETYFDLPITINKGNINYFVLLKSMNGFLNGKVKITGQTISIGNLPVGEKATIIAFTKSNGKIFHCKEEFIIKKDNSIKLDFKDISADEITKMFGKNVKI